MKKIISCCLFLGCLACSLPASGQQPTESVYGDKVKADVKMNYLYSLDEAKERAAKEHKLIFCNCFIDWAVPCHGMNKYVFSDADFCSYMDKKFINLFMDMNTPQGKEMAEQYGVKTYAHYLVLDAKGNVVLRIIGGSKLPAFQESVALALNDKTSLVGAKKRYEKGKRSREVLYNYLRALNLAGESATFDSIVPQYLALIEPKDLLEEGNRLFWRQAIPDAHCEEYHYMVDNKAAFVERFGERVVNVFIESLFCSDMMRYATGQQAYNAQALEDCRQELERAALPDTCMTYVFYNVAQLRGQKKYTDLIHYLEQNGHYLVPHLTSLELSLNLTDIGEQEKPLLVNYLEQAREKVGSSAAKYAYKELIDRLNGVVHDGIQFAEGSFQSLLDKAREKKQLLFVDCYTTWCGPCRMMSSLVFSRKDVGDYFNAHVVSAKIDMEKGEGIELAKQYKVTAYPTMLLLDADGKEVDRIVGARSAEAMIQFIQSHIE